VKFRCSYFPMEATNSNEVCEISDSNIDLPPMHILLASSYNFNAFFNCNFYKLAMIDGSYYETDIVFRVCRVHVIFLTYSLVVVNTVFVP